MRKALSVVTKLLALLAAAHTGHAAERSSEVSVQASASVQSQPARITLTWPADPTETPNSYTIFRKAVSATSWGSGTSLPGTASSFVDSNVTPGIAYEYQIVKRAARHSGYGYVCSGIDLPPVEDRGRVLLVVDNSCTAELAMELARLEQDLTGDGWSVTRIEVSRSDSPAHVKSLIRAQYLADPANTQAVFLFGHVPVPYSGDIVPDGHAPDHQGAWPADGYYGDMAGTWTDSVVNDRAANDARNHNVPGDGKFDQSTFPAPLRLMVGRVDLANMPGRLSFGGEPTFPSEIELLRNYLNKNHQFRHKQMDLPRRGLLGDYFGYRDGEAFAASGWRNLAAFFGAENVVSLPQEATWVPTLSSNAFLWAYGCGPGSYNSIGGLGNSSVYHDGVTPEFYRHDLKAAFTMLFGSWLGDWDSEDNLQRAVLALPSYGLACVLSGRPHWFLHHMAMGQPIGYSARLTQNNGPKGLYQSQMNNCAGQVHIALMGDPTLRLHTVAPPTQLHAFSTPAGHNLRWKASRDEVVGYHVYRGKSPAGPFLRLTREPVIETAFVDPAPGGQWSYMVRAVKLEVSASGSYYNSSQAAFLNLPDPAVYVEAATNAPANPSTQAAVSAPTLLNLDEKGRPLVPTGSLVPNSVVWVDDSLPAGAVPESSPNDAWSWVVGNPSPASGVLAHQSTVASGLHEHWFSWATQTLPVGAEDSLFAYVYLDPANPPSEIMLQWFDGSWDHRAYWGANNIPHGTDGTQGRRYMGRLPTPGQWVRLEVPARQVGLENSVVSGMAFSLFNGRASWDFAGKAPTASLGGSGGSSGTTNTTGTVSLTNNVVWVEDALPAGAQAGSEGGDSWAWINNNPAPYAGTLCHQSSAAAGLHQHYFAYATGTLAVGTGDVLYAWVYLDPANPPREVMLQWNDGTWEHRAYWGANLINYGVNNTVNRFYAGPLPASGKWVRLEVPASKVGLEGSVLSGMAFTLFDGRAAWDTAGKARPGETTSGSGGSQTNWPPTTGTNSGSTATLLTNLVIWVDDAVPAGAQTAADGGDAWAWASSNPTPISGTAAHQSTLASGLHQHYFAWATKTLQPAAGDVLFAYVYLDPANPPSQVMLQWYDGSWDHRAYWGANRITYGTDGTASRRYVGPLPAPGQWVRLEVPASEVGLEGSTINGMAFSQVDGRATWDCAGKGVRSAGSGSNNPSSGGQNPPTSGTNNPPVTSTNNPPLSGTNNPPILTSTNGLPGASRVDYLGLELPQVGDHALKVLAPNLLELKLINTKLPDQARVSQWDLVDANSQFMAPPASAFVVTANGAPVNVSAVGFRRRPIYAPISTYDLRIENSLYLQLAAPISDGQVIEVKNSNNALWPATMKFVAQADPLRYSPAIHVNQEGYMPAFPKRAMVGYYLGSLGEMPIPAAAGFKLVDAVTGAQVFQGTLKQRLDTGYQYSPTPYQKVYEADFTAFTTPGQYRLVVPGLGGSLPFVVSDGIAMSFTRAYALGLYHQRCGTSTTMPYTRHVHDKCHASPASVPSDAGAYPFTWTTIAGYANTINQNNPPQIAPRLTSPANQLFPFNRQGTLDTSGGHHDAGDYSKYTANSASLVHYLMFAADSLDGVAALDNLGIPESGDGISDLLQEAKWEADFLAKLQDTDGGFYFLVYPRNREYEGDVAPDKGDAQVVWPKTTSATAASVAALAQCASSPKFKQAFPAEAAAYLEKAKLGWQFLMNAVAKFGKNGAYQKITHYGDDFADNDELAWAAAEMFLATGDQSIHALLKSWFDPANPATWRWGWWHMSQCWGHAIRSYAFAARSGRIAASALDAGYLGKCQAQVAAAGDDVVQWQAQNAYGSSFPLNTKHVKAAGWYFSTDQAFDVAVAYQLNPKPQYIETLVANMNFEGGCNPVNVTYITGLGWKRQRDVVSQWAVNDRQALPPSGEPVGNITANFGYMWNYGTSLNSLGFPADGAASAPYPFYDRWGDSWNVNAEFVVLNSARSLGALSFLAAQTSLKAQPWKAPGGATISVPTGVAPLGKPVTLSLQVPGMDTRGARVVWEARDQEPAFGDTYTIVPKNNGTQWVEAEAQWPDGRRVFATASFNANSPDIVWFDDSLPAGAAPGADGGDAWNWTDASPAPKSGAKAHQSNLASGGHQHYFDNATATLAIGAGDVLYTWVYLDPANPPSQIMLQWNDGSWDHRAYWGANQLPYGLDGTPGRVNMGPLPAVGQWVQLKVPAAAVALEGRTLKGMAFSLFGGRATFDATGRLNTSVGTSVAVNSASSFLSRTEKEAGTITFSRVGDTSTELAVNYMLGGTAVNGIDYDVTPGGALASSVVIPAGSASASVAVAPRPTDVIVGGQSLVVSLASAEGYAVGNPAQVQLALGGNTIPSILDISQTGARLSWPSGSNRNYQIAYKDRLDEPYWKPAGQVRASGTSSSWMDSSAAGASQRFYLVAQVD